MHRRNNWAVAAGLILIMAAGLYFAGVVYFTEHFYYGTRIDGIDFSWKNAEDVKKHLSSEIGKYVLTVLPREGEKEDITADDISLEYEDKDIAGRLVKEQERLMWPVMLKGPDELTYEKKVSFDHEKAAEKLFSLRSVKDEGKHDSEDAFIKYDGESFVIVPEVYGTLVDKSAARSAVYDAISKLYHEVDLEKAGCYTDPERLGSDGRLNEACETMNRYLSANITFDMGSGTEVVDKGLILDWILLDDDLNVTLDDEGVSEFIGGLGRRYNRVSTTRSFTTPTGRRVSVSGGRFGMVIDEEGETEALSASVKAGETVTRKPVFVHLGSGDGGSDWGDTFVEVDITAQHMWCIIDGSVVLESDVITGQSDGMHDTPTGVHRILRMLSPTVLVGHTDPATGRPAYLAPVDYWMQVTWGGVGLHDATWHSEFGGNIYTYDGSHGCINMPYSAAQTLYGLVYIGMPVVIHY